MIEYESSEASHLLLEATWAKMANAGSNAGCRHH